MIILIVWFVVGFCIYCLLDHDEFFKSHGLYVFIVCAVLTGPIGLGFICTMWLFIKIADFIS